MTFSESGLTQMQWDFAMNILSGKRQGESAILAGYSPESADQEASRQMKHEKVRAVIDYFMEARTVGPKQVLALVSDHATGSMDFFFDEDGAFDLAKARRLGVTHLIHEITYESQVVADADGAEADIGSQSRLRAL